MARLSAAVMGAKPTRFSGFCFNLARKKCRRLWPGHFPASQNPGGTARVLRKAGLARHELGAARPGRCREQDRATIAGCRRGRRPEPRPRPRADWSIRGSTFCSCLRPGACRAKAEFAVQQSGVRGLHDAQAFRPQFQAISTSLKFTGKFIASKPPAAWNRLLSVSRQAAVTALHSWAASSRSPSPGSPSIRSLNAWAQPSRATSTTPPCWTTPLGHSNLAPDGADIRLEASLLHFLQPVSLCSSMAL